MVGNILDISGARDDRGAAERAGWRFIQESEFARGVLSGSGVQGFTQGVASAQPHPPPPL